MGGIRECHLFPFSFPLIAQAGAQYRNSSQQAKAVRVHTRPQNYTSSAVCSQDSPQLMFIPTTALVLRLNYPHVSLLLCVTHSSFKVLDGVSNGLIPGNISMSWLPGRRDKELGLLYGEADSPSKTQVVGIPHMQ